jgi:methyl-accepting chemotaxis protein WspA
MKNMTIWRRLNTALLLLILLLLVSVGLALWVEEARSTAIHRSDVLAGARDRIELDVIRISDALRGLLLDTKNDSEARRRQIAETDLYENIQSLQGSFPDKAGLSSAINGIKEFVLSSNGPVQSLHRRVLEMSETDPVAAVEAYNRGAPPLRDHREQLLRDLSAQIEKVRHEESVAAWTTSVVGLVCIAVVLIGSVLVGRFQSAAITAPLSRLISTLERMRQGDFTERLVLDRPDEFGVLSSGLNRLADDLSQLVGQVQKSGLEVNSTVSRIAAGAREQQTTALEIANTTAEMGETTREISSTSRELVKTMNEVRQVAEETAHLAHSGQSAITRMETTMRQLVNACGSIISRLAVLSEKTANINSVVGTITKVADQTNLLSLNAAIEAEKAGEYGLGFAVVAMEIRRLADQTAVATYDIDKMVKEMQSAVSAGVVGMDKFSDEVRRGVDEISQVSAGIGQIIKQVQTLPPRFQMVHAGMNAQADGAHQISETLRQLSEAAQQTAESLRRSDHAIEQLSGEARGLQTSVAKFKL